MQDRVFPPLSQEFATDLLVARRFLLDGVESVGVADDVMIRRGLLLADLAAESFLKIVLRHHEVAIKANWSIEQMLGQLKVATGGSINVDRLKDPLRQLRNMRNAVMHDGLAQDAETARKQVDRARTALTRLVADVFSLDLNHIRVNDFVRSPRLRFLLDEAARMCDAGEFGQAAALADWAFDHLLSGWQRFLQEELLRTREILDESVALLTSGVYLPALRRFRVATSGAKVAVTASWNPAHFYYTLGTRWCPPGAKEADDARSALDFVGGLTLQVESRFGGKLPSILDAPLPDAVGAPKT